MEEKKRDYLKESRRTRELNKEYHVKINKELAEKFDKKLKEKNVKIADIFRNAIEKFLKE